MNTAYSFQTAYSYIRFSSRAQAAGDSLRRQVADAEAWCERNSVILDRGASFRDLGTSAWLGDHRKNPDRHALAAFLRLAEPGPSRKILPGSCLIVETLCRLTREHIQPALQLVLTILQAGIRIVQLRPSEAIYDDQSGPLQIMQMILELMRANSESETKSIRVSAAWAQKRLDAREKLKPMTPCIPPWLDIEDGKFRIVEEKAATVRRIFNLTIHGMGSLEIVRRFVLEKVPPVGRLGKWAPGTIRHWLRSRSVLGEYQPTTRGRGERKLDGEPIQGYYPAIVDEKTWALARSVVIARTVHRGKYGAYVNVFAGLLHDAVHGGSYYAMSSVTRQGQRNRYIINHEGKDGRQACTTFLFEIFESAIIKHLPEIPASELTYDSDGIEDLAVLVGQKRDAEQRLKKIEENLEECGDSQALARVARKIEARIAEIDAQIAQKRQLSASSIIEDWTDAADLSKAIAESDDPHEARLRLRSILRRTVSGIWLVVTKIPGQSDRYCAAQIFFQNSDASRIFLIWYRAACRLRPERMSESIDWTNANPEIDLRKPHEARRLLDFLLASPPFQSRRRGRRGKP